mgnify:FL=1
MPPLFIPSKNDNREIKIRDYTHDQHYKKRHNKKI